MFLWFYIVGVFFMSSLRLLRFNVLVRFLLVSFGLAYLLDYFIHTLWCRGLVSLCRILLFVRSFAPFIGVLVCLASCGVGFRDGLIMVGLRRGFLRFVVLGLFIPLIIYGLGVLYGFVLGVNVVNPVRRLASLGVVKVFGVSVSGFGGFMFLLVLFLVYGLSVCFVFALFEEVGWRGFLQFYLRSRFSLGLASVIVGLFWGLWYAPLVLFVGLGYPRPMGFVGLLMFVCVCIVWSYILGVLREYSASILAPAVMHGVISGLSSLMSATIVSNALYTLPFGLPSLLASLTVSLVIWLLLRFKLRPL